MFSEQPDVKYQKLHVSAIETGNLFEEILHSGAALRVKVTGTSMTPFIRSGEIVTIRKISPPSLQKGEVVFFRDRQGFPVIHRLIRKSGREKHVVFQTKGDALFLCDQSVSVEHILGKVCKIEKKKILRRTGHTINMESTFWKAANYLLASYYQAKSALYSAIFT